MIKDFILDAEGDIALDHAGLAVAEQIKEVDAVISRLSFDEVAQIERRPGCAVDQDDRSTFTRSIPAHRSAPEVRGPGERPRLGGLDGLCLGRRHSRVQYTTRAEGSRGPIERAARVLRSASRSSTASRVSGRRPSPSAGRRGPDGSG